MSLDFLNGFVEDFNKQADTAAQQQRAARSPFTGPSLTPQKLKPYQAPKVTPKKVSAPKPTTKKKKKDEPFATDVKNFFTGKDTDGDGKPNGLFKALEIIDRPWDALRTGVKEKAEGDSFWEGAKDGFTGKKNTSGKAVNKELGFDTSKEGLPKEIAKFIARGFVGQGPTGKVYTPIVNDKIANQVGTETAGVVTEMALDPLNLIGVGAGAKGLSKGLQAVSNRTVQNLLPNSETVASAISKTIKADTTLPIKTTRPNPAVLDELIPRGNDITNPNYVPSLRPNPKTQIDIPKVGTPLEEALANPKVKTLDDFIPNESPLVRTPELLDEVPTPKSVKIADVVKQYGHNEVTPETIANTYNQKQWYHGTGTDNLTKDSLDPFAGSHESLFGQGIYLTDSPEIAKGYARSRGKKTSTPTTYETNVKMDRVLDLEQPVTEDVKGALAKFARRLDYAYSQAEGENVPYFSNILEDMAKSGKTPEEIILNLKNEMRDFSHDNGIPTSEFVEDFQDLAVYLKQSGYDGITHTGGGRTGHDPHRVLIALDPNDYYAQTGRAGQVTNFRPNNPDELLNRLKVNKFNSLKGNPNTKELDEMLDFLNPKKQKTPTQQVVEPVKQATVTTNTAKAPVKPVEQPKIEPTQPLERPENLPYVQGERKHYSTVTNSEKASDEFINGIKNLDRSYNKISDQEVVDFANGMIGRDVEEAFQFVKNADRFDKRHTAVGARLLDVLQQNKEFEKAVDLADILAKEGTKAGQSLQSFSIYNRLSAEGQLIRAQRRVNKLNQTLPEGKKVVMTPDIAEDIVAAADSIQKLTGQQEIGSSVISLLEKAKKGNTLTDDELKSVQSFMADAKKYVGDIDPKATPAKVKPVKDVRKRDKVIEIMDAREKKAKEELRKILGRANSMPVDALMYLADIGASKIAKGAVKFADFSEQMVKEVGEEILPFMQQIYNKSVGNFNIASEKITPKRLSHAEKLVNKAVTDKTLSQDVADELLDLTKRLVNAAGDSKFEASMELQVALNRLEQPTFAQMISSTHYQAMLLNPLTVMRNIIGNEVFYRVERVSKLLAVPFDIARAKLTGGQRTIVFNTGQFQWGNFMNPTRDYTKGMKLGAKAGWKGVNPLGINTAYDIKSPAFSSNASNLGLLKRAFVSKFNPLHWSEKVLGVTMRSFDTAGYMRAYNQALREQATLRAMNEGLKGSALKRAAEQYFLQADENMIAIAEQYGKYATFQDNTALGRGLTKAKEGMNELSTQILTLGMAKTKDFGAGSFILPFPKTPANLVMRALEYSPAGIIRSFNLIKTYTKTSKNPLDLREGQIAFTRAIMGTAGFSGFGYILADRGVLTSAGNSDYEVKELEKMAGKQPNSVNITAIQRFITSGFNLNELELKEGDTFVSYDWMQPIALSVSLGTGVNQADQESENPSLGERAIRAGDSALNTIVNMSSLSGINRLVSGPPNETWSEKIAGSMQSAGGSFIPTLLNQVRKTTDNTARNTNDPTFSEKFGNTALNRIPGYNKLLPPSFNTFGEKKELYPNNTNNVGNVFFNPSFVSKYKPSPEAKFVLDYINDTGDKTAAPRYAPKTLDGIKLTGAQQSEMQRIMGEEVKKELAKASSSIGSNSTDYERIKKAMDKILTNAGKKARAEIRKELK